ncbi:MAG: hypothetical protein ACLSA2_11445 [Candidatus Gastranaerophilaceae bacterium]
MQKSLNKALEIDAEHEDALVLLGKIYFDESEFDKSKEIFNKFSKLPKILKSLTIWDFLLWKI